VHTIFLTTQVIPIAMLITVTGMVQTRVRSNLMSLDTPDFGLLMNRPSSFSSCGMSERPRPGAAGQLQPIQMRFNELLAGVRTELVIKVYGDDFDQLEQLGMAIETAIGDVEGIADIQMEQTAPAYRC